MASLEQTKEVLITRSESLTDVSAKITSSAPAAAAPAAAAAVGGGGAAAVPASVSHTIEAGLQGAKQILTNLDGRIPR